MDVALLRELGFCQGMENYSRHLAGLLALLVPQYRY
jgi:excinuclease UvrABC helicase subunit UvrB